jgi:hypothetical protein
MQSEHECLESSRRHNLCDSTLVRSTARAISPLLCGCPAIARSLPGCGDSSRVSRTHRLTLACCSRRATRRTARADGSRGLGFSVLQTGLVPLDAPCRPGDLMITAGAYPTLCGHVLYLFWELDQPENFTMSPGAFYVNGRRKSMDIQSRRACQWITLPILNARWGNLAIEMSCD